MPILLRRSLFLAVPLLLYLVLQFGAWLALQTAVRDRTGLTLHSRFVHFNPFTARATVSGLEAYRDVALIAVVGRVVVDLSWPALLTGQLEFDAIEVADGQIPLARTSDGGWSMASVQFDGNGENGGGTLPTITRGTITNVALAIRNADDHIKVRIASLEFSLGEQSHVDAALAIDQAMLSLSGGGEPFATHPWFSGTLNSERLALAPLLRLARPVSPLRDGELDGVANIKALAEESGWALTVEGKLAARHLDYRDEPFSIATQQIDWDGKAATATDGIDANGRWSVENLAFARQGETFEIGHGDGNIDARQTAPDDAMQGTGALTLTGVKVKAATGDVAAETLHWQGTVERAVNGSLAIAGTLALAGVGAETDDRQQINGATIDWTGHVALAADASTFAARGNLRGESLSYLGNATLRSFNADSVSLDDLRLQWPARLDLGNIAVGATNVELQRTASTDKAPTDHAVTPPADGRPAVTLNQLVLNRPLKLGFSDNTFSPPVRRSAAIAIGRIGPPTAEAPSRLPFKLNAALDDHGQLEASGDINHDDPARDFELALHLATYELPPLAPYLAAYTGYGIGSGQADLDLTVKRTPHHLDGKAIVASRGLRVVARDQISAEKTDEQLSIPLPLAIAALEDSQRRINITIPFGGDPSAPDFSLRDPIRKALSTAARGASLGYLKYYFQPWGNLITIVELVGEEIMRIRLDPIPYTAGQLQPAHDTAAYVGKIGKLLQEKAGLHLRLCPFYGQGEQEQLGHDAVESLAHDRGTLLRDALINDYRIPLQRLISCAPELATDNHPRVELSLY